MDQWPLPPRASSNARTFSGTDRERTQIFSQERSEDQKASIFSFAARAARNDATAPMGAQWGRQLAGGSANPDLALPRFASLCLALLAVPIFP
jgi:hypothetical protein